MKVPTLALGLLLAATGTYVTVIGETPGSAILAFVLMSAAVVLVVRSARNRLPIPARRGAVAAGVLLAACAAFLLHALSIATPLFARPLDVPLAGTPAPSPQWAAAVDRARSAVRAAMVEQNLPGVSIAVGAVGSVGAVGAGPAHVVWAEGFGWRDVVSHTPVTSDTRFNIGTAASVVSAAPFASLGMAGTGTDAAANWSPGHIGEPEEDFPGFTAVHDLILRPIGIAPPAQPLPGDRATFYVPTTFWRGFTTDPRAGRRLMSMRDLACCAGTSAFYSTPSDLVRFALATNADSVNGELAGGRVMSLMTRREQGMVVAVTSNIAYADTAALARIVADAFASRR